MKIIFIRPNHRKIKTNINPPGKCRGTNRKELLLVPGNVKKRIQRVRNTNSCCDALNLCKASLSLQVWAYFISCFCFADFDFNGDFLLFRILSITTLLVLCTQLHNQTKERKSIELDENITHNNKCFFSKFIL